MAVSDGQKQRFIVNPQNDSLEADAVEELEELDEILEVVEEEAEEATDTPLFILSESNLYRESPFPVLLMNRNMKILYANPSCQRLFIGFNDLEGNKFLDVFGRSFGIKALKEIRETVLHGINGFSWKGYSHFKSRTIETVQSRVFLFPITKDNKEPFYFEVLFDDVTDEFKQLLRSVFMSLLEASKLKDNDTGKHISRLNYYSHCLALELYNLPGFEYIDADFVDNIGFLASMHDVGKLGTPDDILNKDGPLSDWEWTVMREHTKNGAYILSTYPNPMAKEIALSHHEKWDGTGYPFQLIGDMIPLPARIVTIGDVYDALRMERSYKSSMNHKQAIEKIMSERGTHFDPALLDVFYSISDEFGKIYDKNKDEVPGFQREKKRKNPAKS